MTRPERPPSFSWLAARQRFGVRLGLERMRALLEAVGTPQGSFRSVLVGGTNGKGSTASVLAAALRAQGERVGLTVSPHLERLNERLVVDGTAVSDELLVHALERVQVPAERYDATYFEVVTAAALWAFAEAGVGTAVLEVGLGGRFDATNAVEPALSVVTGVALDHTAQLGDDLRAIAHEKAGILRRDRVAWTAAEGEVLGYLSEEARELGATLRSLRNDQPFEVVDRGWDGLDLTLQRPRGTLEVSSPLVGLHQARNVALALAAAAELGVDDRALRLGSATARWPGRLERLPLGDGWLVLDGAHNPDAAAVLARALERLEGRVPVLVLGVSSDKDVGGVVAPLMRVAGTVVTTRAVHSPRALAPEALAAAVAAAAGGGPTPRVEVAADPAAALALARGLAGAAGTVVAAGSLFLVGEMRALALGRALEPGERWQ